MIRKPPALSASAIPALADDRVNLLPRLYLRMAITGHRTISPSLPVLAALETAISFCDKALELAREDKENRCDKDIATELTLVSGVAEGADQLAVEAFRAVTLAPDTSRRVEIILPFSRQDYSTTMSGEAASRMKHQCKAADVVFEMADGGIDTSLNMTEDSPSVREERRRRNQRYGMLADILVRQADILLAVWDGVASGDQGGTSANIALAMREGLPVIWIHLPTMELRLLPGQERYGDPLGDLASQYVVLTPQTGAASTYDALKSCLIPNFREATAHSRDPEINQKTRGSFKRFFRVSDSWFDKLRESRLITAMGIRSWFREPREKRHKPMRIPQYTHFTAYHWLLWLTGSAGASAHAVMIGAEPPKPPQSRPATPGFRLKCDYVRDNLRGSGLGEVLHPRLRDDLSKIWAYTDADATAIGHTYRSTYVLTFVLGIFAVFAGLFGLFFIEAKWAFILVELATLFVALGFYYYSRAAKIHDRWLLKRQISEQFRPAWALAQLGLGGRRIIRETAPWTAWAMQAWVGRIGLPNLAADAKYLANLSRSINLHIVKHQRKYHRDNAARLEHLHEALEKLGGGAFYLSPVAGVVYLAAHFIFGHVSWEYSAATVTLFGAGLPALASAMAGLRYQGDFLRFASRSNRTANELERLGKILDAFALRADANAAPLQSTLFIELRDIMLSLEAILLADLEDWRFVYGARPNPEP